jgi:GntR family transcriptional regulator
MPSAGSLPLFQQISELLIREIASGRMQDGERFAPERDLAKTLGVSVGTLRKSLADLEARGLLDRRQGSGNYVRAQNDATGVYAFFRVELLAGGGLPTARILDIQRLPKSADLPKFGTSTQAHRIRRLRSLNGIPVALEEIWLDGDCVAEISKQDLSESLYLYYRRALGLWVMRADDTVGLGTVPNWTPSEFTLQAGVATVQIDRLSWSQTGAAIEASRSWIDTSKARYVARLR